MDKVITVLNTVLNIPVTLTDTFVICDAHRLPARKEGRRKPLIFKLSTQLEKNIIWRKMKAEANTMNSF